MAAALVRSIAAQDTAAFQRMVGDPLRVNYLWFASPACQPFTGQEKDIASTEYPAFLRCAASLDLHIASSPAPWGNRPPSTVLTFEPGGEFFLHVEGGLVREIRALYHAMPSAPTIAGKALLAHVLPGVPRIEPDEREREAIAANVKAVAFAFVAICVDEAGKTVRTEPVYHSSEFPTYAQAVYDAATHWTFKPFVHHGVPIPVCSLASLSYPADRMIPMPPPPGPSRPIGNVSPHVFEALRISGDKIITPDDETRLEISTAGENRIVGSFKICMTTRGIIPWVGVLKSTGYKAYDEKIRARISGEWRYRPFVGADGQPHSVCTAVTFIYTQTSPPAPPPP